MPKPNVESGHKATLDSLLLKMPSVVEGKMFGYPAYYVNGKLFACIYGEGVRFVQLMIIDRDGLLQSDTVFGSDE